MTLRNALCTLMWLLAASFALGAAAQQPGQPEYQLGPGDQIRITVFQNPDLTVETRVTEGGTISYPLVGSVRVGGLTIPAAEQTIAKALRDGNFIKQPQVNIVLVRNIGNQVSVLGAVGRPGRYPLETLNTRVSEMLAIAGGISPTGADTVILTGTRAGKPMRKEIDLSGMFLSNRFEDDILVAGGDVIYVHRQPVFYIYGEVQRPGSYRIERGMTIRQALAQGGGLTPRGTERGLRLHRQVGGKVEQTTPQLNDAVQPDDVLFVTESLF
jgi:polysaccharide export outer membrane protein